MADDKKKKVKLAPKGNYDVDVSGTTPHIPYTPPKKPKK